MVIKKWESLRVGQSIILLVAERGGVNEYTTKVQDVAEQWVIVSAPTQRHRVVDIPIGTPLGLLANEGGKLKNFSTQLERIRLGQVPLWVLSRPIAEVGETQRRGFYRLETFLKMNYALVDPKKPATDDFPFEATVINLSGGGLGFYSDQRLPAAAVLKCNLQLDGQRLVLSGRVAREELVFSQNRSRYLIGVQLTNASSIQQDSLVKYIFKEQLRLRAKGLL